LAGWLQDTDRCDHHLCTVVGFALDWESDKSLRRDREFFEPYSIQRIQLAEVGQESDNKGFELKRLGGLY